jgi:hypothetical protein
MLEVPDRLSIETDPLRIEQGGSASLRLEINAKNGFLPKYADALSVVLGPELKDKVKLVSKGRLLGGKVRLRLEAEEDAPVVDTSLKVALVVPELGVLLTAESRIVVVEPAEEDEKDSRSGGEPNIDIQWVGRDAWESMDPVWDEETVGDCRVYREDPQNPTAITKVEWLLNEAFGDYERLTSQKQSSEAALTTLRDRYQIAVAVGLFKQKLAEEAKEQAADDAGQPVEIPDDYVKGEKARIGRAALMALEPELELQEAVAV